MPNVEQDLKDFGAEIEAFFKKLIDRLDGNEDAITDANIMKSDVHDLAGTTPPESAAADAGAAASTGSSEAGASTDTEPKTAA